MSGGEREVPSRERGRLLLDRRSRYVLIKTRTWGEVGVRLARADELDAILKLLDTAEGGDRLAQLAWLGACGTDGERLFSEGDLPDLRKAPLEPITEIATKFLEINGITGEEQKKSSDLSSGSVTTLPTGSAIRTRTS